MPIFPVIHSPLRHWIIFIFRKLLFLPTQNMIKRPTVINMTLNPRRETTDGQNSFREKSLEDKAGENIQGREEGLTEDILKFIRILAEERSTVRKKQRKQNQAKEGGKSGGKTQKIPTITIPLQCAISIQTLLRKYMLCKMEGLDQTHPKPFKPKFSSTNTHLKANIYSASKENTEGSQEDDPASEIFRSIECQRNNRDKLINRNRELQCQVTVLRERVREKNCLISKLLGKETQLRKKYNEQFNRIIRNKNIYDISAHFEKIEEEGEGRNMLNITGKQMEDHKEEEFKRSSAARSGYKSVKTLVRADSEYFKEQSKSRIIKAKGKLNPFLGSRKKTNDSSPSTRFLNCVNKSLPTECISKGGDSSKKGATIEICINHLQSNLMSSKQSVQVNEQERMEMIGKLKDEEFEALQKVGFYE